jgi:hypothetical protein
MKSQAAYAVLLAEPCKRVAELTRFNLHLLSTGDAVWRLLQFMRERGTSVTLNWGEDTDAWEATWITVGDRYLAADHDVVRALCAVIVAAGVEPE